jgi:hypothetical protein
LRHPDAARTGVRTLYRVNDDMNLPGPATAAGSAAGSATGPTVDPTAEAATEPVAGSAAVTDAAMSRFLLTVPLALRSKSNFRRGNTWNTHQEFERSLHLLLRANRPTDWVTSTTDVALAQRPVVVAAIVARSTIDSANFTKSVLDAAEGVLYTTDASVLATVTLAERGRGTGFMVGFAQLPPGSTITACHAVVADLAASAVAAASAAGHVN